MTPGTRREVAQGLRQVAAVAHEHDALNHVVLVVRADDSEAGRMADGHLGDVSNPNRHPLQFGDDHLPDIVERTDEPDAAYVKRLLAQGEPLPPTFWFAFARAALAG